MESEKHNSGVRLSKRDFLLLGVFALAIRCAYNMGHAQSAFFGVPLLDQKYYDLFARTIAAGGDWSAFGGFRPMLYPFFLASLYFIAGAGSGIAFALIVQHALGAATVLLCALGGAELSGSRRAGILAGVLYALAGPPLFFEGELLIESIFPFLVALVLFVHVKAARSDRGALPWIVGGLLLAVACQARPNVLVFWIVYPLIGLVRFTRERRSAAWIPLAGLVAALAGQALFGVLNAKQAGGFHLVTGAGGINFYLGNSRGADGMIPRQAWSVTYHDEYRDPIEVFAEDGYRQFARQHGIAASKDPQAISKFWTQATMAEIRADPSRWIGLMFRKTWLLFWNYEAPNNTSYLFVRDHESPVLRFLPVTWAVLLAFAAAGIGSVWRRKQRDAALVVFVFIVIYSATIVLFFVNGRFRVPLWPAMAMVAGCGADALLAAIVARDRRALTRLVAVIVSVGAASCVNWMGIAKPDYARDFMFRSVSLYSRGRAGEALADIEQSLALDPRDVGAQMHRGNVLLAMGRFAGARDSYAKVAVAEAEEPRVWNNLGAACDLLGDFPAAYSNYLRAVSLDAKHEGALLNVALLELRAGRVTQAAERLKQVERGESNPLYLCLRSQLAKLGGDESTAADFAARARALDEKSADGIFRLLDEGVTLPVAPGTAPAQEGLH